MKTFLRYLIIIGVITALAYFLSTTALPRIFNLSTYSSNEESFSFSDFYIRTASHHIARVSEDIAIVDIGNLSRKDIATLLDSLSNMGPKVVAMDVFFVFPGNEGDSMLYEAISRTNPLLLPLDVQRPELCSYFYNDINNAHFGAVNLFSDAHGGIIRHFQPVYDTEAGPIDGIGLSVADYLRPDLAAKIRQLGTTEQFIRYDGVEFKVFDAEEILSGSDSVALDIKGKAVFVGVMDDPQDKHLTPVESDAPGLLIHAKIAQTVLSDKPVTAVPYRIVIIISSLVCALFIGLLLLFRNLNIGPYASLLLRLIQFLLMYSFFVLGYNLYTGYGYLLDFYLPMCMIGLGTLAYDLSYCFLELFTKVLKKK